MIPNLTFDFHWHMKPWAIIESETMSSWMLVGPQRGWMLAQRGSGVKTTVMTRTKGLMKYEISAGQTPGKS